MLTVIKLTSRGDVVKAYASVFGAYTKLVYNDLDVFENLPIRRIIRRKIRSYDRPIIDYAAVKSPCVCQRTSTYGDKFCIRLEQRSLRHLT